MDLSNYIILCGAGISKDMPANIPTAWELEKSYLDLIFPSIEDLHSEISNEIFEKRDEYTLPILNKLRFEQFMSVIAKYYDVSLSLLINYLSIGKYNINHLTIAKAINLNAQVWTTNFDFFIESACTDISTHKLLVIDDYAESKCKTNYTIPSLHKLHGSLSENTEKFAATIEEIAKNSYILNNKNEERYIKRANFSTGKTLVVIGYSGSDDLDVIPFLNNCNFQSVIWINHGYNEKDNIEIERSINNKLNKHNVNYIHGDSTKYLLATLGMDIGCFNLDYFIEEKSIYKNPTISVDNSLPCLLELLMLSGVEIDYGSIIYDFSHIWKEEILSMIELSFLRWSLTNKNSMKALSYFISINIEKRKDSQEFIDFKYGIVSILHTMDNHAAYQHVIDKLNFNKDHFNDKSSLMPRKTSVTLENVEKNIKNGDFILYCRDLFYYIGNYIGNEEINLGADIFEIEKHLDAALYISDKMGYNEYYSLFLRAKIFFSLKVKDESELTHIINIVSSLTLSVNNHSLFSMSVGVIVDHDSILNVDYELFDQVSYNFCVMEKDALIVSDRLIIYFNIFLKSRQYNKEIRATNIIMSILKKVDRKSGLTIVCNLYFKIFSLSSSKIDDFYLTDKEINWLSHWAAASPKWLDVINMCGEFFKEDNNIKSLCNKANTIGLNSFFQNKDNIEKLLKAEEKKENGYFYEAIKILKSTRYESAEKHEELADCYLELGNLCEAENQCKIAIQINPYSANAYYLYAFVLLREDPVKNREQILSCLSSSREFGGDHPEILRNLFWLYYQNRSYASAINLLTEVAMFDLRDDINMALDIEHAAYFCDRKNKYSTSFINIYHKYYCPQLISYKMKLPILRICQEDNVELGINSCQTLAPNI